MAILVEGWSDQAALEALAHRRGLNLAAERIAILPVGGATNTGKFLEALSPGGLGVRLAGFVDANEEQHLWRGLERVGLGTNLSRAGAEALGFFVCDADLEDELIRALAPPRSSRCLLFKASSSLSAAFRTNPLSMQGRAMPSCGSLWAPGPGARFAYGELLTNALDLRCVPRALDAALAHATTEM